MSGMGNSGTGLAARLERLLKVHASLAGSVSFEELGRKLEETLTDLVPPFSAVRLPVVEGMVGKEFPLTHGGEPRSEGNLEAIQPVRRKFAALSLKPGEPPEPLMVTPEELKELPENVRGRIAFWCFLPLHDSQGEPASVFAFEFQQQPKDRDAFGFTMGHLTHVLAPVVEMINLRQAYRDTLRDSEALMKVSTTISSKLDLKELLTVLARQCSWLLDADRSTVWLYDDETEEIWTIVSEGLTDEIRMPLGRGIAGAVAKSKDTLNIADPYSHPLFNPEVDRETGYLTKSILCMPLKNKKDELIGVYQVLNKLDFDHFSRDDERMLAALSGSAAVAVENAKLYEDQKKQFSSFIEVLATSVDAKDPTTADHSKMVTGVAVALGKQLGFDAQQTEFIRVAGVLHDYGKIAIPDAILCKPGTLTPEEFMVMHSHVEKTITILSRVYFTKEMRDIPKIAGMHHERLDGTGYPLKLKAEQIPLGGRILAVADIFHAMMQERPYKKGLTPSEALAECKKLTKPHIGRFGDEEGAHLDGKVVDALEHVLEREHYNVEYFVRESGWSDISSKEIMALREMTSHDEHTKGGN